MEFTHAGDNGLAGFFVGLNAEGGVFFGEFLKAYAELVEVFLGFGLNGDADHRFGEVHGFEHDGRIFGTEGVAGADILETYACADIAAADHFLGILLVGMHLEQTRDTFLLARTAVENVRAGVDVAGVHAEEAQAAYIGVGCNLERQSAHGCVGAGFAGDYLVGVVDCVAFDGAGINGAWEVCADSVEQALNAFVLE